MTTGALTPEQGFGGTAVSFRDCKDSLACLDVSDP